MMKLDDHYLAHTARIAREIKQASYALLGLNSGSRHLEVGCGSGQDTLALAAQFPDSEILGIDLFQDIVDVAEGKAREQGLSNLHHLCGDAATTVYAQRFHAMRAERVFQHLTDVQIMALVAHLAEYTESQGVFCLVSVDWDTLTATLPARHRDTFLAIKDRLLSVSNMQALHTAMEAFRGHGYTLESTQTYDYRVADFTAAFTAFNLTALGEDLSLDSEALQAMKQDFRDGEHYIAVGGSTLLFRKND